MSNHGSDEVRSDSFLEDLQVSQRSAVLQCSKVELEDSNGSVCEDNKTGIGRACAHDGKENRFFVKKWQKRQRTARDQQRHWVKEQPSYRYPAVENSVWVESMVIVWKLMHWFFLDTTVVLMGERPGEYWVKHHNGLLLNRG